MIKLHVLFDLQFFATNFKKEYNNTKKRQNALYAKKISTVLESFLKEKKR